MCHTEEKKGSIEGIPFKLSNLTNTAMIIVNRSRIDFIKL